MQMVGIYKITSPTNKINIGQSWNIEKRKKDYSTFNCKGQIKLYNSLIKHGWNNHKFEIIHKLPQDVSQEVLDNYEIFYHQLYKDCGFEMLNIREPGRGGKLSEETKQKLSKPKPKNFGIQVSKRMKGNTNLLGVKYSKESKLKQSLSHLGKVNRKVSIICINTNEEYSSIKEASQILEIHIDSIKRILSGKNCQTRNKLKFKYKL